MSAYVVWMDSSSAKIFHVNGDMVEASKAVRHDIEHHTQNKMDSKQKDSPRFFIDVAEQLKGHNDSVLLVGPGNSKNHFVTYLEGHHEKGLANRIVATEPMDHPTNAQVVAYARKFFPEGQV